MNRREEPGTCTACGAETDEDSDGDLCVDCIIASEGEGGARAPRVDPSGGVFLD